MAEPCSTRMWLGAGCPDGKAKEAERPVRRVRAGQESEPASCRRRVCDTTYRCGESHERHGQHKPGRGKAGQEGGYVMSEPKQESAASADEAMHGAETHARRTRGPDRGVKAEVWTERMHARELACALSALVIGVKGGKWLSLMDKVLAPKTLAVAWTKVRSNKGAAGVDGQSIERFAAKAELYLSELSAALREGTYRPQAVRRVDIPKGDGKTRPCPCGAWLRHDAFRRSRIASSNRRSGSSSNRSSSTPSRKGATASVSCWKHAFGMTTWVP